MTLEFQKLRLETNLSEAQLREKKIQLYNQNGFTHAQQFYDLQQKVSVRRKKIFESHTPQYASLVDVTKAFTLACTNQFRVEMKNKREHIAAYNLPNPLSFIPEMEADSTYIIPEIMPEYPECPSAEKLTDAIWRNRRFPADWWKGQLFGSVEVGFIVNENGAISDIKATNYRFQDAKDYTKPLKNFDKDVPLFLKEAERVIASLPQNWLPGVQGGKTVKVRYVVSVVFSENMK